MKNTKNIWAGTEDLLDKSFGAESSSKELFDNPLFQDLAEENNAVGSALSSNRRDFLKYLGFGLGAATIAASCEAPIRKALPYVTKPDAIVPGVASYYASSFIKGGDYCPVIVKTREGRPIKIEGNSLSPMTKGGTSARAQASVLDLYNISRLRNAGKINASEKKVDRMEWADLDNEIIGHLRSAGSIRIVGNTDLSVSNKSLVAEFQAKYPATKVVTYDAYSSSAMLDANQKSFGMRVLPSYNFANSKVTVSFGADFLGTWISPVEYARQFADGRRVLDPAKVEMSRLYVVESTISLTGSNADHRVIIKPSEQGLAIAKLNNELADSLGGSSISVQGNLSHPKAEAAIKEMAKDLLNNRGSSLVVSNSNNTTEQLLVNNINSMLGNYGQTLDMNNYSLQRQGSDKEMLDFVSEVKSGSVDAVIFMDGANPVYDLPEGGELKEALSKVKCKISFSLLPNETWSVCDYAVPTTHWLESWMDAQPKAGLYSLAQPTIRPLFEVRSHMLSFMKWMDKGETKIVSSESVSDTLQVQSQDTTGNEVVESKWDAVDKDLMKVYDYMKSLWQREVFPKQNKYTTFRSFWDNTLHDGFVMVEGGSAAGSGTQISLTGNITKVSSGKEVMFYESVAIGAGHYADNPWLQEMPDPLTRVVWANYVHLPIEWDGENFKYYNDIAEDGTLVNVGPAGSEITLPVVRQFGQMKDTFAIALGYGREISGAAGIGVGERVNQYLKRDTDGNLQFFAENVEVSGSVGKDDIFACVQLHHTMGLRGKDLSDGGKVINVDEKKLMTIGNGFQGSLTERSVIFEGDLSSLEDDVHHLEEKREEYAKLNSHSTYDGYDHLYSQGHHWGLAVDMNACIGCGACAIACIAENNVPIVGKKEVHRVHEMTWMRIDRYYYGEVDNPNVVYQPMMCQHCDNAPCENVCPVAATTHSSEGLNQMTYNRCVGTRYCANNCPYKVRRFNWLDYNAADLFPINEVETFDTGTDTPFYAHDLTRMVLNPDVTVRARGVIEKCSFCVQRIQEGKLKAKSEGRRLMDGEVKSACQTSCPTGAIVFGDMNNKESEVAKIKARRTSYIALEETNVRSSVDYQMRITNRNSKLTEAEA